MLPTSSKKTASKKLESIKLIGGSKFMKELQKTVFFAAYYDFCRVFVREKHDREGAERVASH